MNTLSILEWVQEHVEHTCIQNHVGLDLCMVQNQGIWLWGEQTKALIRNWCTCSPTLNWPTPILPTLYAKKVVFCLLLNALN